MSEKQEGVKTSVFEWAIPGCLALLLGLSVWVLAVEYPRPYPLEGVLNRPELAVRQGLLGLMALALAIGLGRFLAIRQVLRLWWVPLPLLGLLLIAIPVTSWAGWASIVKGTAWWHRSPGWIISMLVTISGLMFALPRLVRPAVKPGAGDCPRASEAPGMAAFAGTLLYAAAWPTLSDYSFVMLFVLFGIIGLSVFAVLQGSRRWAGLFVTASIWSLVLTASALMSSRLVTRLYSRHVNDYFQGYQAQSAIHAGGWTGSRIHPPFVPEWNTDFIVSRICNVFGLMGGILLLVLVVLLLTLVWRIVARQSRPESRVLAAGCAAVLTVRTLLHIAINTGLWPLMPMPSPFLSYGPVFLLFDGMVLGVLLALGRDDLEGRTTWKSSLQEGTEKEFMEGRALSRPELHPSLSRWPVTLIQVGIVALLVLVTVRLCWLVNGEHSIRQRRLELLQSIEARLQEKNKPVRGRILDVHGRVLAQHGQRNYVCADPQVLAESPDRHLHADLLRLIGLDAEEFARRTSDTNRRYARLATVPTTTAEAVRRMNLRGIFIDSQPSRDYLQETPLTHIAGFVTMDGMGGSGVEQSRDRQLVAGTDVRITLDAELQAAVQAIAAETHAAQVQIVVMNPRTGAVLAAAQVPATHAGDSPSADPLARTWRSNMDVFEPGGLISPLIAAAAFDMGVVKIDTPINTENGVWTVHGIPLRDPQPYTEMTPAEILIKGCNIGMAKIGVGMGTNALHEAMVHWGFNAPAATCIPGAGSGTLHPPGRWDGIAITRLPIGHGMACTLMQLMRAYTAFFNDGRMVEPYIIEDGKRGGASARPSPVSAGAAALVRGMLERVVVEGTGQAAALEGVAVFGKTAVVQKAISGGYAEDRFQTAFIGGFERDGSEPVLIAVWLDEPVRDGESNPAVAVFKTVAERMVHGGN